MMTKEECAQTLIGLVLHEIDPEDHAAQHACLRGAKALLKDGIHNRRNHASRVARGLPPFCQPLAKTPETCQPLAKPAAGAEPWVFAAEED
jgi:hypothetical protein